MILATILFALLSILLLIDSCSLIAGYFPSNKYFYWIYDLNTGVIPLFLEDLSIFYNRDIEKLRNITLSVIFLAISISILSLVSLIYFIKRRFLASRWPLNLWRLSTFACALRLLIISWAVHKFHFKLVKDIIIELDGIDTADEALNISIIELYKNGIIGYIPASLYLSILLNIIILILAGSLILSNEDWRQLNFKPGSKNLMIYFWRNDRCSKLLGLVSVFLVLSSKLVDGSSGAGGGISSSAGGGTGKVASPSKAASKASAGTISSLSLDTGCMAQIQMKLTKSPLKVEGKATKELSLDFDGLFDDSDFYCTLIDGASIYREQTWSYPLKDLDQARNIMNLEAYLKKTQSNLSKELFDDASSFSWISDAKTLSSYVMVVCTSISQLAYLLSQLNHTENCLKRIKEKIGVLIHEHLKVLAKFCSDISSNSGRFGMTHLEDPSIDPTKYFVNLLYLRSEPEVMLVSDAMFVTFVEFLFESFGNLNCEKMIRFFLDSTSADSWIPIPIKYLRNRMFFENPEQCQRFASHWRLKAFGGSLFDDRHLVSLGYLLQQGMISQQLFLSILDFASINEHNSRYILNGSMVRFLTLTATTPWLLPENEDSIRILGNFSNPQIELASALTEIEKVTFIEKIWKFFVTSEHLVLMRDDDYENLSMLINRLDKAFPGIYLKLWALFKDRDNDRHGFFFVNSLKLKIDEFKAEALDWPTKLDHLERNFTISSVLEDTRLDADSLYLLLELFTDILSDGNDLISDCFDASSPIPNVEELTKVLTFSVKFLDYMLTYIITSAMIEYWYAKFEFIPTSLFDSIFELCGSEYAPNLNAYDSSIFETISRLINKHPNFARSIMLMQKAKATKNRNLPLFGKMSSPACLIASAEANTLNFEIFEAYINSSVISESFLLSDFFFSSLAEKIVYEEISFESAHLLLSRLAEYENLRLCSEYEGFSNFWNMNILINVNNDMQNPAIINTFRVYLKLLAKSNVMNITTVLLRNLSNFMGFYKRNIVDIVPDKGAPYFPFEVLDRLVIGTDQTGLIHFALDCITMFHVNLVNSQISLKTAKIILEKLLIASKSFVELAPGYDINSELYSNFIYAFNCALLAIIRIPNLVIQEEAKVLIQLYEFYKLAYYFVPDGFVNLISTIPTKSATLVMLYGKMINDLRALPASAFDYTILRENSLIWKIQSNYINMIGEHMKYEYNEFLVPLIKWINDGKVSHENVIKLMKLFTTNISFSKRLNFVPILAAIVKCPIYTEIQKYEILNMALNQNQNEFIRNLCTARNNMAFEEFINIFKLNEARVLIKYLDKFKSDVWYDGLKQLIARSLQRQIVDPSINSTNLTVKYTAFNSVIADIISATTPNYMTRRHSVTVLDTFMSVEARVLPLLGVDSETREPFEYAMIFLAILNYELVGADGCFVKIFPKSESFFAELLRSHTELLINSPYRKPALRWILESFESSGMKLSAIRIIPQLISSQTFVLFPSSFKSVARWFNSQSYLAIESAPTLQEFLGILIEKAFDSILRCDRESEAPVLDEMFSVLYELFDSEFGLVVKSPIILNQIIDGLIFINNQNHKKIIHNSQKLMPFLKKCLESSRRETEFLNNVIIFLKANVELYLNNSIEWELIWKMLSQSLPLQFRDSVTKIYLNFGQYSYSKWEPSLELLPLLNLPSKVLVNILAGITSQESFRFNNLKILLLVPDDLIIEDFDSYDQVESVLNCIQDTIDYLMDSGEDEEDEEVQDGNDEDVGTHELTLILYKKLFVLINFNCLTGHSRSWTWPLIFDLLLHSENLRENEHFLLDTFYKTYPHLIEYTLLTEKDIYVFLYEMGQIEHYDDSEIYYPLIERIIEFHDNFTFSSSVDVEDPSRFNLAYDFGFPEYDVDKKQDDPEIILSVLNLFVEYTTIVLAAMPHERNDAFARNIICKCLNILYFVYANDENDGIPSDNLKAFSNQITLIFSAFISRNNLISFAESLRIKDISCFVKLLADNVDLHSEFHELLTKLMDIDLFEVSDHFFEQISYGNIRTDICYIPEKVIQMYDEIISRGFRTIDEGSWPSLYLDGLIKGSSTEGHIDPGHFERVHSLIDHISDIDSLSFVDVFEKLNQLVIQNHFTLQSVFRFMDKLFEVERFKKLLNYSILFIFFLTNQLISKILPLQTKVLINYLRKSRSIDEVCFENWLSVTLSRPNAKMIRAAFKEEATTNTINLHTKIAEAIISDLEESTDISTIDFAKIIKKYKNIKAEFVESEVLSTLYHLFLSKLFQAHGFVSDPLVLKETVVFILNLNLEPTNELIAFVLKVFDDDIFIKFTERYSDPMALKNSLMILQGKVTLSHVKLIKKKLVAHGLYEDMEVIEFATRNSQSNQVLEYFQDTRTLSLENKLHLLNTCSPTLSNEKVTQLLTYFKSLLPNCESDLGVRKMILKAMLANPIFMSQFYPPTSRSPKNRVSFLALLKKYMSYQISKEFIESNSDEIGEIGIMILKLYYRSSAFEYPVIKEGTSLSSTELRAFFDSFAADALTNTAHSPSAKTQLILKTFKLGEELERLFESEGFKIKNEVLIASTNALNTLLATKVIFIGGVKSIYSTYKMISRLSGKRRERNFIMKHLLITPNNRARVCCFTALLQAQLDSHEIDWELLKDLGKRTKSLPKIQELLADFKLEHDSVA